MKIGVAVSGSGAGAGAAYCLADELRGQGAEIAMLSACSLAAVSLLLWSRGLESAETDELMTLFTSAQTPACALAEFERMGIFRGKPRCELAVSSVDVTTGVSVIYCDRLRSDAHNLLALPLSGNERAALASTVSPYGASEPFPTSGMRLCDFSARYGCPFFPLKMAGMERLLAVSFSGASEPAQVAAESLSALTGKNADLHYALRLDAKAEPNARIREFVRLHEGEIYDKLLF